MGSKLATWILIAAGAGVAAGWAGHALSPDAATAAAVASIAGMDDAKAVGRIGGKALGWFITASLVPLLIGMLFANLLHPGSDRGPPLPDAVLRSIA